MSPAEKRRRGRKRLRTRAQFYDLRDSHPHTPKKRRIRKSTEAVSPDNVSKALNRGINRSSKNKSGNFRGYHSLTCLIVKV